jgi:1-acyl-sn-glycerol-3-phosphate acyltransferase
MHERDEGPVEGARDGIRRYARGAGEPPPTWIYRAVRALARELVRPLVRVQVEGLENVPASGPFILVANHQSILDPILVQSACPRPVHTLTKSSQFGTFPFGWLLPRILALPARRYRVDPQVVRLMLRRLGQGEAVGIYPEGERTWDGTLQPIRRGTVRVLLRAGVPVVPCGISGAFHVWPRWGKLPRRGRVVLRFGRPLQFGVHRGRVAREAALPEAMERLGSVLQDLSEDLASTPSPLPGEWGGAGEGEPGPLAGRGRS